MLLKDCLPVWNKLTANQQAMLESAAIKRRVSKGELLHNGSADCVGLIAVGAGQLRAFIMSDEGKEVTVFRLFERDMCLFSASCMIHSIQFELAVEAETDSQVWFIPPDVYKNLMSTSLAVANYTNDLMASRFSEVMWLVEQIMWKSVDKRLAAFLIEECRLTGSASIKITHDKIAAHMGTAREVVTRMLRYFQSEGFVELSRGTVAIKQLQTLEKLAK